MTNQNKDFDYDYVLIGGGLQSGLIALALRYRQPDARVAIIERDSQLAGNHTWSFHASDMTGDTETWIQPLLQHHWPAYDVHVGGMQKRIGIGYHSISSDHFAAVVSEAARASGGCLKVLLDANVVHASADSVTLHDGQSIRARCVIDNRGPRTPKRCNQKLSNQKLSDNVFEGVQRDKFPGGFQKFWGFELSLPADWHHANPVVMDDRIDQADGFRFLYTLPFQTRRVLVEDTRFSDTPTLDRSECFLEVDRYLRRVTDGKWGIENCEIVREESGVLPMPYRGSYPSGDGPTLAGGYRGGWFHAATGYSFPLAIQFADWVSQTPIEQLSEEIKQQAAKHRSRASFARFLNRLLFVLVKPETRYQIFRRFYRVLPEHRIARFYGHRFTALDAARIIIGIPPLGLRPIRFAKSFFSGAKQMPSSQERSLASQPRLASFTTQTKSDSQLPDSQQEVRS